MQSQCGGGGGGVLSYKYTRRHASPTVHNNIVSTYFIIHSIYITDVCVTRGFATVK